MLQQAKEPQKLQAKSLRGLHAWRRRQVEKVRSLLIRLELSDTVKPIVVTVTFTVDV